MPRAAHTSISNPSATSLTVGPAGIVFGYDGFDSGADVITYALSASGVTGTYTLGVLSGSGTVILYEAGRLYASNGAIADVSTPAHPVALTLKLPVTGPMAVRDAQRLLVATSASPERVAIIDQTTFAEVDSVMLPSALVGVPLELAYLGGDGVAILMGKTDSIGNTTAAEIQILHAPAIGAP